jgi:hypothetical protein
MSGPEPQDMIEQAGPDWVATDAAAPCAATSAAQPSPAREHDAELIETGPTEDRGGEYNELAGRRGVLQQPRVERLIRAGDHEATVEPVAPDEWGEMSVSCSICWVMKVGARRVSRAKAAVQGSTTPTDWESR